MTGSKAKIFIESDQDLESMAAQLSQVLSLPAFWMKSDTEPPHAITAMAESLGHELWLREADCGSQRGFEFELETTMPVVNHFTSDFGDISEWLAKHLKTVADLTCRPVAATESKQGEQVVDDQSPTRRGVDA